MKLISKFKDFYDFCIYQFGEDPLIFYNRTKINFSEVEGQKHTHNPSTFALYKGYNVYDNDKKYFPHYDIQRSYMNEKDKLQYAYVFICGINHMAIKIDDRIEDGPESYRILTRNMIENNDQLLAKLITLYNRNYKTVDFSKLSKDKSIDLIEQKMFKIEHNVVVKLSVKLRQPVFMFHPYGATNVRVCENIPNLSSLGYSCSDPISFYQKLCWYISNVINNNADIKPPVEISNNDKIVKHGFDTKTSFRNM